METIFQDTQRYANDVKEIPGVEVVTSISNLDKISADHENLKEKLTNFTNDVSGFQSPKFGYQVSVMVLFPLFAVGGLSGYFLRRSYIPWIGSMLIFIFTVPFIIVAGLECAYIFLQIDFCSVIGNSITSGITPSENKRLGTYLSCPSKDVMRIISTDIYEYIISFNAIHEKLKTELESIEGCPYSVGDDIRNNTHFEYLYNELQKNDIYKQKHLDICAYDLFTINNILAGLLSMSNCRTAKNSINFIEENFCYTNSGYMLFDINNKNLQ